MDTLNSRIAPRGFTLIEVIAALLLGAIVLSLLLPLSGQVFRSQIVNDNRLTLLSAKRGQIDEWIALHRSGEGGDMEAFSSLVQNTSLSPGLALESTSWVVIDANGLPVPGNSGDSLMIVLSSAVGQMTVLLSPFEI